MLHFEPWKESSGNSNSFCQQKLIDRNRVLSVGWTKQQGNCNSEIKMHPIRKIRHLPAILRCSIRHVTVHYDVVKNLTAVLQQSSIRTPVNHHAETAVAFGRSHHQFFQIICKQSL